MSDIRPNLNKLLKVIGLDFITHLKANYKRQQYGDGSNDAIPYEPLSPATVKRKAAKDLSPDILYETGFMESRFKHSVRSTSVVLSNDTYYAKYHQDGDGVPKRPIIYVDDAMEEKAHQILLKESITIIDKIIKGIK